MKSWEILLILTHSKRHVKAQSTISQTSIVSDILNIPYRLLHIVYLFHYVILFLYIIISLHLIISWFIYNLKQSLFRIEIWLKKHVCKDILKLIKYGNSRPWVTLCFTTHAITRGLIINKSNPNMLGYISTVTMSHQLITFYPPSKNLGCFNFRVLNGERK